MSNALEIKNLNKKFKTFSLQDINLTIPKGSVLGLVGKNGSGKSTIINSIFNIVKPDSGQIFFYSEELNDKNKLLKNDIGTVFDSLYFSLEMKIAALEKILDCLYPNFDFKVFNEYLTKFDLPKDKKLKTFSRGMGMKLQIAIALSHKAKFLVLDEATAGLDPVIREEILDIFIDFVAQEENAILISSHISSDLERLADYIAFIDEGKIILTDTKDNFIYNYGIARLTREQFDQLSSLEYLGMRNRGLQIEVLVNNKQEFCQKYPSFIVDNSNLDEILALLIKGDK